MYSLKTNPLSFQEFQKDREKVCPGCTGGNSPKSGNPDCSECYRFWREMKRNRTETIGRRF